jgi:hypothetical protein
MVDRVDEVDRKVYLKNIKGRKESFSVNLDNFANSYERV